MYGTGLRSVQSLTDVTVEVGGTAVPVTYAGKQSQYEGLLVGRTRGSEHCSGNQRQMRESPDGGDAVDTTKP